MRKKLSKEEKNIAFQKINDECLKYGATLNSSEYVNNRTRLDITLSNGESYSPTTISVLSGHWKRSDRNNITNKKIKNELQRILNPISEIKHMKYGLSHLRIICKRHNHITIVDGYSVLKTNEIPICKECRKIDLRLEKYKYLMNKVGLNLMSTDLKKYGDPADGECIYGHGVRKYYYHNLLKGHGCDQCSNSTKYGEELTRFCFETITGEKFPNCRPEFMRQNSKSRPFELDGYNKKHGIAFEYQGEQHFNDESFIYRLEDGSYDRAAYLTTRIRDIQKPYLCSKIKVTLIQVYNLNIPIPDLNNHILNEQSLVEFIILKLEYFGYKCLIKNRTVDLDNFRGELPERIALERTKEIHIALSKINATLLTPKITSKKMLVKWQCKNGSIRKTRQSQILRGNGCGCRKCSNNDPYTEKEIIDLTRSIHPKFKVVSFGEEGYKNQNSIITFSCSQTSKNHLFEKTLSSFLRNSVCSICSPPNEEVSLNRLIAKSTELGFEYLDSYNDETNNKISVKIKCKECNDIIDINRNLFLYGKPYTCEICGNRFTSRLASKKAISLGGRLKKRKGNTFFIVFSDEQGEYTLSMSQSVLKNINVDDFKKRRSRTGRYSEATDYTLEDIRELVIRKNGVLVNKELPSSKDKFIFQCENYPSHPEFEIRRDAWIANKNWCPECKLNTRIEWQNFTDEYDWEIVDENWNDLSIRIDTRYVLKIKCRRCGAISSRSFHDMGHVKRKKGNHNGCSYCSANRKKTQEEVEAILNKNGFSLVAGHYTNAKSKLVIHCNNPDHPELDNKSWDLIHRELKRYGSLERICPECRRDNKGILEKL